ncbi:MAG: hypothetical protein J7J25_04440 [Candidatus Omnitrophica bacterium]|nr:hypothetical protein [Candidatus Omnitrophota bacterium]
MRLPHSFQVGLSFGLNSAVITTLALMIGLAYGSGSKAIAIGGVLIVAIADALSDALGIHLSEESENRHTDKEIWQATFSTFFAKFIVAVTFVIPLFLFPLLMAAWINILWGIALLFIFNIYLAHQEGKNPLGVVGEHMAVGALAVGVSILLARMISSF